jgi:hypothetical protein
MNRQTWMVALLVAGALGVTARPARAQGATTPAVLKRGFFTVSGGHQPTANAFSKTYTWPMYAETASANVSYPVKGAFLFDVGGGVRVWHDLAVGAAFSYYTRSDAGGATVSVPSPFDFNAIRTTQASAAGLTRTEAVVHVQASWFVALSPKVQLAVSGGPSLFRVTQPFVSVVNLHEVYPYDTLSVTGFTTTSQSASTTGFNAGADLTWMLTRQIGVGGLVRFSRASVSFDTPDKTSVAVRAGGLQVAAGLRARF